MRQQLSDELRELATLPFNLGSLTLQRLDVVVHIQGKKEYSNGVVANLM